MSTSSAPRPSTLLLALALALCVPAACTKKAPRRHASSGTTKAASKSTPRAAPAKSTPKAKSTKLDPKHRARLAEWIERGPLSPAMKASAAIISALQKALLSKPTPADAFAPMTGSVARGLAAHLAKTNPKELRMMGFEFELLFSAKGAPERGSFYLRTFMHTGERGPEFFKLAGRVPTGGKLNVTAHPISAYKGPNAKLLARAAQGLAQMLKSGRCQALPMVSPEPLAKIMQPGVRSMRMLANLRRARAGRRRLCASLGKLDLGDFKLRLDDVSIAVIGQNGRISGMLGGEIELRGGKLHLKFGQYRSMGR
jgi:hypothetical protein